MANPFPELEPHGPDDLTSLLGWFGDRQALRQWGGPKVRWPLRAEHFVVDVLRPGVTTRVARDDEGALLAFGQFYRKLGRCHLARLAVRPEARGRGLGRFFVMALMAEGRAALGVEACSLYVLAGNRAAIGCYEACGFRFADDPEPLPDLPDCLFMIAERR